jgi:hypothetical protein
MDIQYQITCCGKTLFKGAEYEKRYFMHNMAMKAWEMLKEHRSPHPIRYPLVESSLRNNEGKSPEDFKKEWENRTQQEQALTQAPRIYLDMVVTTPDRNMRVLFKIVEGIKCDIRWYFVEDKDPGVMSNHPSCLGSLPYKHLFEYGDSENPKSIKLRMFRNEDIDIGEVRRLCNLYNRSIWYNTNIVKTFKEVVDNMSVNDMSGMSFKDCLNVRNAKTTILDRGSLVGVGNVCDEDLHDQIQFGLTFCWLIISGVEELVESSFQDGS